MIFPNKSILKYSSFFSIPNVDGGFLLTLCHYSFVVLYVLFILVIALLISPHLMTLLVPLFAIQQRQATGFKKGCSSSKSRDFTWSKPFLTIEMYKYFNSLPNLNSRAKYNNLVNKNRKLYRTQLTNKTQPSKMLQDKRLCQYTQKGNV